MNIWYKELVSYIKSDEAVEINSLREYFNNLNVCYAISEFVFKEIYHENPRISKKKKDIHFDLSLGCDVIYKKSEFMLNELKHAINFPIDEVIANFDFFSKNIEVVNITRNVVNTYNSRNVYSDFHIQFTSIIIKDFSKNIYNVLNIQNKINHDVMKDFSAKIYNVLDIQNKINCDVMKDFSAKIYNVLDIQNKINCDVMKDFSANVYNVLDTHNNINHNIMQEAFKSAIDLQKKIKIFEDEDEFTD